MAARPHGATPVPVTRASAAQAAYPHLETPNPSFDPDAGPAPSPLRGQGPEGSKAAPVTSIRSHKQPHTLQPTPMLPGDRACPQPKPRGGFGDRADPKVKRAPSELRFARCSPKPKPWGCSKPCQTPNLTFHGGSVLPRPHPAPFLGSVPVAEQVEAGMQRGAWAHGDKGALICCGVGGDAAFLTPQRLGRARGLHIGEKIPSSGVFHPIRQLGTEGLGGAIP